MPEYEPSSSEEVTPPNQRERIWLRAVVSRWRSWHIHPSRGQGAAHSQGGPTSAEASGPDAPGLAGKLSAQAQRLRAARPPSNHWNYILFLIDFLSFGVGFTFVSLSSVIPSFVRQMTDSAPLVGLASTIYNGGWTLPQLFVARLIIPKRRKKPSMLVALPGRILPWVITAALWAGLAHYPSAMLVLFFVCWGLFAIADGIASVPWYDILGRTIPLKQRGRLFGTAQAAMGLAGIGVGALVALILNRFAFPGGYALLFLLWGVGLIPSTVALFLMWEPPPTDEAKTDLEHIRGGWMRHVASDRRFRRLMLCRILFSMAGLATPFYVVHAVEVLQLPEAAVGTFVIAQTLAGIGSSAALGLISERRGPRYVIRIGNAVAVVGPLYALAAHLQGGWIGHAYPLVFVLLGIINSTLLLGFSNYMLEIAPDELRSAYVGFGNTVMGLLAVTPVLGGWLLEATSYPVLFGLTAAIAALGFVLTLSLGPSHSVEGRAIEAL